MDTDITFIVHGPIQDPPNFGVLAQYELLPPTTEDLFKGRMDAMYKVSTPFFCVLDGGPDKLLPGFSIILPRLLKDMQRVQADIGLTKERPTNRVGHHATICRTAVAQFSQFPRSGKYHFETLVYGFLSRFGTEIIDRSDYTYEWLRSVNGASTWPDVLEAMNNSLDWLFRYNRSIK